MKRDGYSSQGKLNIISKLTYDGSLTESISGVDLWKMYNMSGSNDNEIIYVQDPDDASLKVAKRGTKTYYGGFPSTFVDIREYQVSNPTRFKGFTIPTTAQRPSSGNSTSIIGYGIGFEWYPAVNENKNKYLLCTCDFLYSGDSFHGVDLYTNNGTLFYRYKDLGSTGTFALYDGIREGKWHNVEVLFEDNGDMTYTEHVIVSVGNSVVSDSDDYARISIPYGEESVNNNNRGIRYFNSCFGYYGTAINSTDYIKNHIVFEL